MEQRNEMNDKKKNWNWYTNMAAHACFPLGPWIVELILNINTWRTTFPLQSGEYIKMYNSCVKKKKKKKWKISTMNK